MKTKVISTSNPEELERQLQAVLNVAGTVVDTKFICNRGATNQLVYTIIYWPKKHNDYYSY